MYQEIIYSGDHVFDTDFIVEPYQKVIFQNGDFAFTSGTLIIFGILAMYNLTWTSDLSIYGNSECIGTNITFSGLVNSGGNTVASLTNITFLAYVDIFENSVFTLTDAVFSNSVDLEGNSYLNMTDAVIYSDLSILDFAKLTMARSSLVSSVNSYQSAQVNLTDCTIQETYLYGTSIERLLNCTIFGSRLYQNATVTIINSSVYYLYEFLEFMAGNWVINQNILSGIGSYYEPTSNLINSTMVFNNKYITIEDSTNILFNNSNYYEIDALGTTNLTLETTYAGYVYMGEDSNATIIDSTIINLNLDNNGTIYLENVTIATITVSFQFYKGNIIGYNGTFIGAESWRFPKITQTNVTYGTHEYSYDVYNQVNFTLINTTNCVSLSASSNANVTIMDCNMPLAYLHLYNDANVTVLFSTVLYIGGYSSNNITISNTTCDEIELYWYSFARIIQSSHVDLLILIDHSDFYQSPDSSIDTIEDRRI